MRPPVFGNVRVVSMLSCVTACCRVLQHVVVCHSMLSCVTACCRVSRAIRHDCACCLRIRGYKRVRVHVACACVCTSVLSATHMHAVHKTRFRTSHPWIIAPQQQHLSACHLRSTRRSSQHIPACRPLDCPGPDPCPPAWHVRRRKGYAAQCAPSLRIKAHQQC